MSKWRDPKWVDVYHDVINGSDVQQHVVLLVSERRDRKWVDVYYLFNFDICHPHYHLLVSERRDRKWVDV